MKQLKIKKVKKGVTDGYWIKEVVIHEKAQLHYYLDDIYGGISHEQAEEQEDELNAIHRLQNGIYTIDHGDYEVVVEISDSEEAK